MAEKKKHTNGKFLATARINGKKRFFYSRISQEDADEQAAAARRDALPKQPIRALSDPSTFASFVYERYCPRKYESLRKTSRNRVDSLLRMHVLPTLGQIRTSDIGYDEVQQLKTSLKRMDGRKGKLSPRSVREVLMIVREALTLYKRLQEAKGGFVREDWKLVKMPRVARKKVRSQPEPAFTAQFLSHLQGHWFAGPAFCALFLAMRRGEVCGLKWSAIDRKRMQIKISEQRHPLLDPGETPKGDKPRVIPITPEILELIDQLGDPESSYVFTMPAVKGGRRNVPLMPNEVSKACPKLCEQAELSRRTFHDLRSFAASNLIAIGAHPYTVMEILGHSKIDTTTLYIDGREAEMRQALDNALQRYLKPAEEAANA